MDLLRLYGPTTNHCTSMTSDPPSPSLGRVKEDSKGFRGGLMGASWYCLSWADVEKAEI